jgi:choline-sulfatase/uncharacterized sulfatase
MTRPNVIFILSDQHNAKVLSHKGHPDVKTPSLDRLAQQGVRFDNAITQNPICTPSRVSFLSGQYPHNHGYYGLMGPNPGGLPSVLGHFRRHGYTTAAIGKIHCPEYWIEDDSDLFGEVLAHCSVGGNPRYMSCLNWWGKAEEFRKSEGKRENKTHTLEGYCSSQEYRHCPEGWCVSESIEFIKQARSQGKPFFLHVSFPRPHQPYCPTKEFWEMYDEDEITLPPNADSDLEGKAPHLRAMVENFRKGDWTDFEPQTYEAGRRRKLRGYLGNVSQVDFAVGELMDYLQQEGLAEDTVFVYTADHGDYACEHGVIEKAPGICADAITRIPMIWRWGDKLSAGHVAEPIVEAVDVPTTLCSLAGLPAMGTSDGLDLTSLLRGSQEEIHRFGVTEFAWSRSIRQGDWRLVIYPPEMFGDAYPQGFGELYNIRQDPWEMENLYFRPDQQERIGRMRSEYLDWLITTTRPRTMLPLVGKHDEQMNVRWQCATWPDGKISPDDIRRQSRKQPNYT